MSEWYEIKNIDEFDSPCLVIYKDRVLANIREAIRRIGDVSLLRPHVKTNKIAAVCRMMMDEGITKFKCATIAEAEMLAMENARDVLLAYQPVGPKKQRLLQLIEKYPATLFSTVVDNVDTASELSELFANTQRSLDIYIDLNTGMNRTGASEVKMYELTSHIMQLNGLNLKGLHAYDGHVRDSDPIKRQQASDDAYKMVTRLAAYVESKFNLTVAIVAGGSPSFGTHINRKVECSPGTFVFWDWGYHQLLPNENYAFAALLVTRVLSVIDGHTITTDLGHKAVAAENPLPRVHFLNVAIEEQLSQSEEHLVLRVHHAARCSPGDILYAVPYHICPTVALYNQVLVAENSRIVTSWTVTARGRKITI